jgi:hypothetical protein
MEVRDQLRMSIVQLVVNIGALKSKGSVIAALSTRGKHGH